MFFREGEFDKLSLGYVTSAACVCDYEIDW